MIIANQRENELLRLIFDALPSLVFVVDRDVRVQECNKAAAEFLAVERSAFLKKRAGELFHCIHSTEVPEGCGRAPFCKSCIIRNSVSEAFQGNRIVRRRTRIEIIRDRKQEEIYSLITVSPFFFQKSRRRCL
jgi:PAS domain-containing protein